MVGPPEEPQTKVGSRKRVRPAEAFSRTRCLRSFWDAASLRAHGCQDHPPPQNPTQPLNTVEPRGYGCAMRPKRFGCRPGLGHHVRREHPDDTRRLFTCPDDKSAPVFMAPKRLPCSHCDRQLAVSVTLPCPIVEIHKHRVLPRATPSWLREEPHAETAGHLLVYPALVASRHLYGTDSALMKDLVRSEHLASWLHHVFQLRARFLLEPSSVHVEEHGSFLGEVQQFK